MTMWKKMPEFVAAFIVIALLTGCTFSSSQATLERQHSEPWWPVPALANEVYPREVLKDVYPTEAPVIHP